MNEYACHWLKLAEMQFRKVTEWFWALANLYEEESIHWLKLTEYVSTSVHWTKTSKDIFTNIERNVSTDNDKL